MSYPAAAGAATGGAGTAEAGIYPSHSLLLPPLVRLTTHENRIGSPAAAWFKSPILSSTPNISRSSLPGLIDDRRVIRNLFFRDAAKVIPMLQSNKDFVVYFISSHSAQRVNSFEPPVLGAKNIPYCVVQTGGGDAVGCEFAVSASTVMGHLFSKELLYSFQYLLGLTGDVVPRVFSDLHYSTNDTIIVDGKEHFLELIPNKILSFQESEIKDGAPFGVYRFNPNALQLWPLTGSLFQKIPALDTLFTRSSGTTIGELLPLITAEDTSMADRPAIFVFHGCSGFAAPKYADIITRKMSEESKYQFREDLPEIRFAPKEPLPLIARSNPGHSEIPLAWRGPSAHGNASETVRTGVAAANTFMGLGIPLGKNMIIPSNAAAAAAARPNNTRKKNTRNKGAAGPVRISHQRKEWGKREGTTMSGTPKPPNFNKTKKNRKPTNKRNNNKNRNDPFTQ